MRAMTEKSHEHAPVAPSGFFVLRTPLLPVEELLAWTGGLESRRQCESGADPGALERAWSSDVELLRARLRTIVQRPEIRQALYVASPALQPGIDHWLRDPDSKKGLQAERSIVRYFARMCGRCTPFGLFSGCSTGVVGGDGDSTAIVLEPRSRYRSCSRLDFDYLFSLTTALRRDTNLALELRYWPNSSLRRTAGAWRYTESRLAGSSRSHHLVKLEDDAYLSAALTRAGSGATVAELMDAVISQDPDRPPSEEETREYVLELVRNEVLVPSLTPLVTGEPPLDDLIRQLESLPSARPVVHGRSSSPG